MDVYAGDFAVEYKSPRDPVTKADKLANEAICRYLAAAFPGVPIVAEESAPETFATYAGSERIFFVDPLDGTREFIAKNGEFVVMIGLVEGERATHGVVLAPSRDTAWAGKLGEGCHRIDRNGVRETMTPRSLSSLTGSKVVVSRSHRSPTLEQALRAQVAELISLGSVGLKAARVLEGTADAYAALGAAGSRWDACGPDALVHAAGGLFTDARGKRFDYRAADLTNSQGIAAANPALHAQLVAVLSAISDEDHSLNKPA
jgi:3'(2'), 5'-bisphosphate nucleotidase